MSRTKKLELCLASGPAFAIALAAGVVNRRSSHTVVKDHSTSLMPSNRWVEATIPVIPGILSKVRLPFVALMLSGGLWAQTPAGPGKTEPVLLTIEGKVEVSTVGSTAWTPARTNQVLRVGERVRTGLRSRATLRLSDKSVFRINELTTLKIQPPPGSSNAPVLDLGAGSTYFYSREKPAAVEFRTPLASGAIRGTEFNLAVGADGR